MTGIFLDNPYYKECPEHETDFCTYCGGDFKRSDLVIVFQSDVACPECLAYSKIQAEMNNELLITKPL